MVYEDFPHITAASIIPYIQPIYPKPIQQGVFFIAHLG